MPQNRNPSPMFIGIVASVGMFLSTLDSGIINIALPTLLRDFDSPINHLIWIVTLYTLMLSASIMLFGRLADIFGRLKVYKCGLIFFALSSLLCGFARNTNSLILFRGIQGLSAAMIQATAAAIIMTQVNSDMRSKIMGFFGMMTGLGPLMGPVLGGLILSSIGWRCIFWLNIPICLVALIGVKKLKFCENLFNKSLNFFNLFLFGAIMALVLLAISMLSQPDTYIESFILIGMAGILLIVLCLREYYSSHPIIARDLIAKSNFILPLVATAAFGGATAITFMLPPLFFENIKNYFPWQVGIVSLFTPVGMVFCAKFSGYLVPKLGTKKLMILGLTLMLISLTSFSFIHENWNYVVFILLLLIYGMGAGIFQTPNIMHAMCQAPSEKQASVGAFLRMVQNAGIAVAAAGSALFIAAKPEVDSIYLLHGIREGWIFAAVMIGIALLGCIYILSLEDTNNPE